MNAKKLLSSAAATAILSATPLAVSAQAPRPALPVESLRSFVEVFQAATQHHSREVRTDTLLGHAIRGMLRGLDPYSEFLDKEAFNTLRHGAPAGEETAGIGVELGIDGRSEIAVIAPLDGAPASFADLRPGDIVESVNGVPTKGLSLSEAIRLIRGKPGTSVSLSLRRPCEAKSVEVELTREIIQVAPMVSRLVASDVGYLRIRQFSEFTIENLARQMAELLQKNGRPLAGLVLDLRSSPGGLFQASIAVASAFLPEGAAVVRTEGRSDGATRLYRATSEDYLRRGQADLPASLRAHLGSLPVALLLDRGTASGAEVVAAALKDHKRARLVGERTFGRAALQTVFPLGNGTAVKLTTATMVTTAGEPIEAQGVTPHETIGQQLPAADFGSTSDKVFQRALEILRQPKTTSRIPENLQG